MKLYVMKTSPSYLILLCCLAISALCMNSAAAEKVTFTYCNESSSFNSSSGSNFDCIRGGAMRLDPDITAQFDGCRITAVDIVNGLFQNQDSAPFTLFFTNDLNQEAFYTTQSEMDISSPRKFKEHTLPEPVVIKKGTPLYVGITIFVKGSDYSSTDPKQNLALCRDNVTGTDYPGGFSALSSVTDHNAPHELTWEDEGRSFGQYGIRLHIESNNFPRRVIQLTDLSIPHYMSPNTNYQCKIKFLNLGTDVIEHFDAEYGFGDNKKTERFYCIEPGLGFYQRDHTFFYTGPEEASFNQKLTFRITALNGEPYDNPDAVIEASTRAFAPSEGYGRNVVVEEGSGQGCGWCVGGIVSMKHAYDKYPDGTLIPISALSYYGTLITGKSYQHIWEEYFTHIPSNLIDRDMISYGIRSGSGIEYDYEQERTIPAIVKVTDLRISPQGAKARVSSAVEFAFDETTTDYRMAYVITEDNVGPHWQANSYSGMDIDMDGWEKLPSHVEDVYFDFVAREITAFHGHEGSIPADIKAGESYSFATDIDMSLVRDLDKCRLIAMVINGKNDHIENALMVKLNDVSAIDTPYVDTTGTTDLPVEYFRLDGVRVAQPAAPGIYIDRKSTRLNSSHR